LSRRDQVRDNGDMDGPLPRLYRRLGPRYFLVYLAIEGVSAFLIALGTTGLLTLYEPIAVSDFLVILGATELASATLFAWGLRRTLPYARPMLDWVKGRRGDPVAAWRSAVALPQEFVARTDKEAVVFLAVPIAIFATALLELPAYSAVIIFAGAVVAIAYAALLHFFASEQFLRPVVREIAAELPAEFSLGREGIPLRWKLLGALPLINVITGVVVSGLSTDGGSSLNDLGVDVLVALLVAFTISFELTLLVTRSVLAPVRDLLDATKRVKQGDLSARVPVTSGDELGSLTASFNEMMTGVSEREALYKAFGSYVAPEVAKRVVKEGALLEGEEVEVTILFVDIRGFTAFAERSSARESVAFLNRFFDLVVPILAKHGGYANKFIGDAVLGVFGVPDIVPDHADRALRAACEIADAVEETYGSEFRIGIGVNSGPVLAGTVGGGGRLDFTVIGDPVNVTARVQEISKSSGDVVLLTEATRCLLTDEGVELEPRGAIPLRGKSEPVPIHVLVRPGERVSPEPVSADMSGRG
jgi:class 3 adenylate cyclase